jgi:hypothetical protein
MPQCLSSELHHLDLFLFSLLFSGSVALRYFDIGVLFVLFYSSFYLIDMTKDGLVCTE